jgi:hypothetical protein
MNRPHRLPVLALLLMLGACAGQTCGAGWENTCRLLGGDPSQGVSRMDPATSAALMGYGAQMMKPQAAQPAQMPIRCQSVKQGAFIDTTCR